jgi:predicted nucleic acid-binding protein
VAQYLGDKSALARLHQDDVLHRVSALYLSGQIATCGMIDLELLYSARNGDDHRELAFDRQLLPRVPCGDAAFDRAIEVQGELADAGRHRSVALEDLIIAAAAEQAGLAVLHYDQDYDLIAEVTGQPMEWVVPRGSVP